MYNHIFSLKFDQQLADGGLLAVSIAEMPPAGRYITMLTGAVLTVYFIIVLHKTITFNCGTLKNTQTGPPKNIIIFNEKCLESADKIKQMFFFPENYSRRVRKSTNKLIMAF